MTPDDEPIEGRGPQEDPSIAPRMVLTLGLAGLFGGLAIVIVFVTTLPMIEANRAEALRKAVFQVVPGSAAMQKLVARDGALAVAGVGAAAKADAREAGIYAAYDGGGAFLGYAIPGDGAGFQDTIRLLYGFDPTRKVVIGLAILESKETPGLGDKIFKDAAFQENFRALAVEPDVVAVKHGQKSAPNEVDAITGATISSKAVVKIINASNAEWLSSLPAPGAEPALVREPTNPGDK